MTFHLIGWRETNLRPAASRTVCLCASIVLEGQREVVYLDVPQVNLTDSVWIKQHIEQYAYRRHNEQILPDPQ